MRIFVTGGTGFIGRYTVDRLRKSGHDVFLLTRSPKRDTYIQCIKGDLAGIKVWSEKVRKFKPDKAVHLAWESLPDYSYEASKRNLLFGLDFYEFLTRIGCKGVITSGSCWEYGVQNTKLSEDMPILPMNAFTAAKNALNQLGGDLARESQMQYIWVRVFFAYGVGQRALSLLPRLIAYAKGGEVPMIKDSETELDFIYVEDVADAIVKLIQSDDASGTYNIGSGKLTKVREVVEIVGKLTKKESEFQKLLPAKDKSVASYHSGYYADISKIKKEVGWKPQISIDRGVAKMIQNFTL